MILLDREMFKNRKGDRECKLLLYNDYDVCYMRICACLSEKIELLAFCAPNPNSGDGTKS